MNIHTAIMPFVFAATACGGLFSTSAGICQRDAECSDADDAGDDSDDGSDDVAVCTAQTDGLLEALRANAEPECAALASAIERLNGCRSGLTCDQFNADDNDGKCDDQLDALGNACDDIADGEIDCESLLQFQCGFGA